VFFELFPTEQNKAAPPIFSALENLSAWIVPEILGLEKITII
jgi:hypothetical protein